MLLSLLLTTLLSLCGAVTFKRAREERWGGVHWEKDSGVLLHTAGERGWRACGVRCVWYVTRRQPSRSRWENRSLFPCLYTLLLYLYITCACVCVRELVCIDERVCVCVCVWTIINEPTTRDTPFRAHSSSSSMNLQPSPMPSHAHDQNKNKHRVRLLTLSAVSLSFHNIREIPVNISFKRPQHPHVLSPSYKYVT
jgi:hypothetical protein